MNHLLSVRIRPALGTMALLGGVFLNSCSDMFSTEPVTPKPQNINTYSSLFAEGSSLRYRMQEWVLHAGSDSLKVSDQLLEFEFQQKQEYQSYTWTIFNLKISNFSTGESISSRTFKARLDTEGPVFLPDSGDSGPRFFLLKTGSGGGAAESEFQTLPNLLLDQSKLDFSNGPLTFHREVTGTDTIAFRERYEETWLVKESVLFGNVTVVTGIYSYAESGLLECTQVFPEFEHRNQFGEDSGTGQVVRTFNLLE